MKIKDSLENLSEILKVLRLYIAGIIAVFIMYFLLTGIDQGIDVVIQAGEFLWPSILSIVAVALWSYLIWFSCRILSYTRPVGEKSIPTDLLQLLPRLLAYNCFVCIQVAIFSLPTFYSLALWQILLFIALHNILYYCLHQWFTYKVKSAMIVAWVFIIVQLAVYIFLMYQKADLMNSRNPERHKFWLPLVGSVVFLLQIRAIHYFIRRRQNIDRQVAFTAAAPDRATTQPFKNFDNKYLPAERHHLKIFSWISAAAIAIYCCAIFSIKVADEMGPMAFVMLALGVLVGFSNLITYFGARIKINLFFFLFILAVIIGKFGNPYKVRSIEPVGKGYYANRPGAKAYMYKWAKKREHLLDGYLARYKAIMADSSRKDSSNLKFPVYIVLSDGGASRAGNWVCSVLSSLQDSSAKHDPNDVFSDHLLAIAGASGGSVGNATFYAMLRSRQEGILKGPLSVHCDTFFDADFLTFTLGRLFGPDFFRHIVPIRSVMDRGAALETVLAEGSKDHIIDPQLDTPLSAAFDTSGALPIFFITTTRVQDGMPSILSSVKLRTERFDVTTLLDSTDIRFSTAAILSSRFPYVSPAGGIKDNYFVDGGYVDNAGSGIMIDLLEELDNIKNDTTDKTSDTAVVFNKFRKIISFHVIHIYNSPKNQDDFQPMHPLTNDIVTPLLTLAGMQGSSTLISTENLLQYFKIFNADTSNAIIDYSLYQNIKGEESVC